MCHRDDKGGYDRGQEKEEKGKEEADARGLLMIRCESCKGSWFVELHQLVVPGSGGNPVIAPGTNIWKCHNCGTIVDASGVFDDNRKDAGKDQG